MASIDQLIDDILNVADSGIRAAVNAVWGAVKSIWSVATDFWWRITKEASFIADAAHTLRNWGQAFISHVYTAVAWIIRVAIPKAVGYVFDTLIPAIEKLVGDVVNLAYGLYHTVVDWASKLFNSIVDTINHVIQWAEQEVAAIWHDLRAVITLAVHFLTVPEILVEWFWDAWWRKLQSWAKSNEEAFARWLWARAVSGTLKIGNLIEDLIIRIL